MAVPVNQGHENAAICGECETFGLGEKSKRWEEITRRAQRFRIGHKN